MIHAAINCCMSKYQNIHQSLHNVVATVPISPYTMLLLLSLSVLHNVVNLSRTDLKFSKKKMLDNVVAIDPVSHHCPNKSSCFQCQNTQ